jgi:hypothetical protein
MLHASKVGTLFSLLALPVLLTGCAHAQAKTTPDAPLDMPAPPPRDVAPNEAEAPPPPVTLVPEPVRSAPARPRPAPREQPRPEPPKPDAPPSLEPAKPAEEPARPATTLQTAPATVESEQERAIRATLARATSVLNRVDYRALSADARTQYDAAKRFIQQAEEAMRTKNLVFARTIADKASVLAAQLGGR